MLPAVKNGRNKLGINDGITHDQTRSNADVGMVVGGIFQNKTGNATDESVNRLTRIRLIESHDLLRPPMGHTHTHTHTKRRVGFVRVMTSARMLLLYCRILNWSQQFKETVVIMMHFAFECRTCDWVIYAPTSWLTQVGWTRKLRCEFILQSFMTGQWAL